VRNADDALSDKGRRVNTAVVFALAGIGSYLIRATMLVLLAGRPLPKRLGTPVALIAPAAVGALTVSSMSRAGRVDMSIVAAAVISFVVVRRSGRLTYGLIAGFAVVWVLAALTAL